jgi:2-keto-3-deoxy-galactonokinase
MGTKTPERTVTLHFIDGTKLSLEFPDQSGNQAARKTKIADLMAASQLVIEAEGAVLVCPMANIKYMSFSAPYLDSKAMSEVLPRHAIVGARIRF